MDRSSSRRRSSSASSHRRTPSVTRQPILVVSNPYTNTPVVRSSRTAGPTRTVRKSRSPPLTISSKPNLSVRGAQLRARSQQTKIAAVVKSGDPRYRAQPSTTSSVPVTHVETVQTHRGPIQVQVSSRVNSPTLSVTHGNVSPPMDPSV